MSRSLAVKNAEIEKLISYLPSPPEGGEGEERRDELLQKFIEISRKRKNEINDFEVHLRLLSEENRKKNEIQDFSDRISRVFSPKNDEKIEEKAQKNLEKKLEEEGAILALVAAYREEVLLLRRENEEGKGEKKSEKNNLSGVSDRSTEGDKESISEFLYLKKLLIERDAEIAELRDRLEEREEFIELLEAEKDSLSSENTNLKISYTAYQELHAEVVKMRIKNRKNEENEIENETQIAELKDRLQDRTDELQLLFSENKEIEKEALERKVTDEAYVSLFEEVRKLRLQNLEVEELEESILALQTQLEEVGLDLKKK